MNESKLLPRASTSALRYLRIVSTGKFSLPASTGVCVVNTVVHLTMAQASSKP